MSGSGGVEAVKALGGLEQRGGALGRSWSASPSQHSGPGFSQRAEAVQAQAGEENLLLWGR